MKPNIIMIYTDQQSKDFISLYNENSPVKTPNIDSIGSNGLIMDHCYTPSAVCTPSRGCLMTGRYPHTNGAYRNDAPLAENEDTIAHRLKDNGYKTAYVGKWHLAGEDPEWMKGKRAMGFDESKYMFNTGHHKKMVVHEDGSVSLSRDIGDEKDYMTDFLTDRAIDIIKETEDQPLFLLLSIPDPHQPFVVREPYASMYKPDDMPIPPSFYQETLPDWAENDEWGRKRYYPMDMKDREMQLRQNMAMYCGEVKCIDDNVGKLIDVLKDKDMYENTILMFTTDHGEYMGEHGLHEKNNLYQSVYHIPMLCQWPGNDAMLSGSRIEHFMNVVDIKQTLLGLADLVPFGNEQGRDMSPVFLGHEMEDVQEVYLHPNDVPRTGIITKDYELAYVDHGWDRETYPSFNDHILFDRINDPHQLMNLYDNEGYKDVVEALKEKIRKHHSQVKTPMDALPRALYE